MAIKLNLAPIHVGEHIREDIILGHGLSIARAARILKVRTATLSDLLNERTNLSPEMAVRLEKAFGVSADYLMRWQANYAVAQVDAAVLNIERYEAAAA